MPTKSCSKCGIAFPATTEFFYSKKHGKYGVRAVCKFCEKELRDEKSVEISERAKIYYALNKEYIREQHKDYYNRNKTDIINRTSSNHKRNKVIRNSSAKKYYLENKDKMNEMMKQHYCNNREYYAAKVAKYRTHKKQALPPWADMEAIRKVYKKAREMFMCTGVKYHVDHIIPINNHLVCGLHVANNLQIITETANKIKGNSFSIGV